MGWYLKAAKDYIIDNRLMMLSYIAVFVLGALATKCAA